MSVPRRTRGWALLVILSVILGLFAVPYIRDWSSARAVRKNSIAVLLAAKTEDDRVEAVGYLGVVLQVDGGWIAIRYKDTHNWPGYSVAVVRCSDGSWFESSKHYCGLFSIYRSQRKQVQEFTASPDLSEKDREEFREQMKFSGPLAPLQEIETCGDMARAKELLHRMEFAPMAVPGT